MFLWKWIDRCAYVSAKSSILRATPQRGFLLLDNTHYWVLGDMHGHALLQETFVFWLWIHLQHRNEGFQTSSRVGTQGHIWFPRRKKRPQTNSCVRTKGRISVPASEVQLPNVLTKLPAGTWIRKIKFELFFDWGGRLPPPQTPLLSRPDGLRWWIGFAGWLADCLVAWLEPKKKFELFFRTRIKSSWKF